MGARLFTAVLPPREVVAALDTLLEPRRDGAPWRWTRPEGWHLTTCFMESVEPHQQDELVELLGEVASRTAPFTVGIEGAHCFPSVERARALTMAVTEGHEPLAQLAERCRHAASRAGARPDGARFVGHLTLGRSSQKLDATRWVHVLDSFPGWGWLVEELVLVQSFLGSQRGYEVLERFRLGDPFV